MGKRRERITLGETMNRKGRFLRALGVTSVAAVSLAMMATSSGASSSTIAKGKPVTIGISLSLSGDFSADGNAFKQGYQLWADSVNKSAGLLGHLVKLDIVSDASSPTQVVTNCQKLISLDHVNLTFGPFSSLLSLPAAKAVARYGYAMVEGAGGAPVLSPIYRPISPVKVGPERNVFNGSVDVTLTSETPGVQIHYTLDGTPPTPSSPLYRSALTVPLPTTVTAGAFHDGHLLTYLTVSEVKEILVCILCFRFVSLHGVCPGQLQASHCADGIADGYSLMIN